MNTIKDILHNILLGMRDAIFGAVPKQLSQPMIECGVETDQEVLNRKCHEYLTTTHW